MIDILIPLCEAINRISYHEELIITKMVKFLKCRKFSSINFYQKDFK